MTMYKLVRGRIISTQEWKGRLEINIGGHCWTDGRGITLSGLFETENYSVKSVVQDGKFLTAIGSSFVEFGIRYGKALGLEFSEYWYKK